LLLGVGRRNIRKVPLSGKTSIVRDLGRILALSRA
jgi:hypothetical protein